MAYRNDDDRDWRDRSRGRDWRDRDRDDDRDWRSSDRDRDEYGRDRWFLQYEDQWTGDEPYEASQARERWDRGAGRGGRGRGLGRWYGRFGSPEGVGSAAGYSGMGGPGWTAGGFGDPGYNTSGFSSPDYGTSRVGPADDRSPSREPMPFSRERMGEHEHRPIRGRSSRWGAGEYDRGYQSDYDRDYDRAYTGRDRSTTDTIYEDRWGTGPHTGRGPRGYQRSDERIRDEVSDRLMDHGHLDASAMEVSVQNGEVTLTGTAENRRAKRLAEDIAESVRGVKDVHNRLSVGKIDRGDQELSLTPEAERLDKKMSQGKKNR